MKVKAAILYEINHPLVVKEVELDPPKANEVLVKMVAAGVCRTDHHIISGYLQSGYYPMILGHEGAGIVEKVGANVTRVKPGDHVVMVIPSCGQCHNNTFRFHDDAADIAQFGLLGCFSEYTIVPESSIVKTHEDIPLQLACLVGGGVAAGVGSVINRAKVEVGSSVAIIGLGGIGMNAVQGARLAGATKIIVVDVDESKLARARKFGATHFINGKTDDVVAEVKKITWNEGVAYSFLTVDYVTPELVGQAYGCLRKTGTCVVVGIAHPSMDHINIMPRDLVYTEKTLMGTLYGGAEPFNDIPRYLDLYCQGKLDLQGLVTKTYTLDQINQAFAHMLKGKNIRGVVLF